MTDWSAGPPLTSGCGGRPEAPMPVAGRRIPQLPTAAHLSWRLTPAQDQWQPSTAEFPPFPPLPGSGCRPGAPFSGEARQPAPPPSRPSPACYSYSLGPYPVVYAWYAPSSRIGSVALGGGVDAHAAAVFPWGLHSYPLVTGFFSTAVVMCVLPDEPSHCPHSPDFS